MFENNDEFGLEAYTKDFEDMFESFKVLVKLIQKQESARHYLQGDFLGIKVVEFPDKISYIYISVQEMNPIKRLKKYGYSDKGNIIVEGYCKKEISLKSGDIIELLDNSTIGLVGEKFIVTPTNIAQFRLQKSFNQFELKKV